MTTAAVATPGVRNVELVNGGYGIKHPLLRHSDVNTRNLINAQQLGQADTFISIFPSSSPDKQCVRLTTFGIVSLASFLELPQVRLRLVPLRKTFGDKLSRFSCVFYYQANMPGFGYI